MNERTNQALPKTFEEWQRGYLKSDHDFYLRLPSEQDRIIWNAAIAAAQEREAKLIAYTRDKALDEAAEALSRVQHVAGNVKVILALKGTGK